MIRQEFYISKYDWHVTVYYAVTCYHVYRIISNLFSMGCRPYELQRAYSNMSSGDLDTGLTYSNPQKRQSLMVIGLTSSPAEFQNSLDHEKGHLCKHISKTCGIDPYGEEYQYLSGGVGQRMFPVARRFLCEHCRKSLTDKHKYYEHELKD